MAVIGTFGSFTAARLGIYASQASLNATGNNIANINTEGYTRQRMDLVSLYSYGTVRYANSFQQNIGYGVLTNGVSQLRDPLLDIRFREENASMGAYDEKLDCLQQLANILDEVGRGTDDFGIIEAQFDDLLSQLENLNSKVGSVEYDTTVRGSAQTLAQLFNSYSKAMNTLAVNKLKELKENVKTVNALLTQIRDLNVQIRDAGIVGDNALELRDARNLCIDKLSSYMKIDVRYDMEKIDEFNSVERINISIAGSGTKLIEGVYGAQITLDEMTAARNPDYNAEKVTDADKAEFISGIYIENGEIKVRYTNKASEAMQYNGSPVQNQEDALAAMKAKLKELVEAEITNTESIVDRAKTAKTNKANALNEIAKQNGLIYGTEGTPGTKGLVDQEKDLIDRLAKLEARLEKVTSEDYDANEDDETDTALKNMTAAQLQAEIDQINAGEDVAGSLANIQKQLADAQDELAKAQKALAAAEKEIVAVNKELQNIAKKYGITIDNLDSIEMDDLENKLAAVTAAVTAKTGTGVGDDHESGVWEDLLDDGDLNKDGWLGGMQYFDSLNANAPYLKQDGTKTWNKNDPNILEVDNAVEGSKDNRLWMTVEPPTDVKGRILRNADRIAYEAVDLTDNELYGSLQSLREFLTEKGEFSSNEDLKFDGFAAQKRGIQYYQNALDALARKFADSFNKANQLNLEDVSKAYVSEDGMVYLGSDGKPITYTYTDEFGNSHTEDVDPEFFKTLTGNIERLAALKEQLSKGTISKDELTGYRDQLVKEQTTLQNELDNLDRNDPTYADKQEELESLTTKIEKLTEQIDGAADGATFTPDDDQRAYLESEIAGLEKEIEADTPKAYGYMEALRSGGAKLTDEWSFYNGGVLFSNSGDNNDPTGINAGNITVSEGWMTGAVRILNSKNADGLNHSTANDNIYHMIQLMSEDMNYYPGEIMDGTIGGMSKKYFTGSFQERLADMNSILGVDMQTTTLLYNEFTTTTLSLENSRQSVAGVDLNDEATNMMVYQKAYAAACQLMTTLDSMLDKLINGTI